jgi:hypothetical protein
MPSYRRILPETRAKWSPTYSGVYTGDICPSHTSYGWIACVFTFYLLLLPIYTLCKVSGVCIPDLYALLGVPMCGISWPSTDTSYGWIACLFTFYPLLLSIYTLCKVSGVCVPDWHALLGVPMCGISWLRRDTSYGWIVCLFTLWTLTLYACSSYAVGYPKSTGWTWCSVTYIYPYT